MVHGRASAVLSKAAAVIAVLLLMACTSLVTATAAAAGITVPSAPLGPGGTEVTVASVSSPHDVAVDSANGDLYATDSVHDTVVQVAPNGSETTFASGFNNPLGVAVDS